MTKPNHLTPLLQCYGTPVFKFRTTADLLDHANRINQGGLDPKPNRPYCYDLTPDEHKEIVGYFGNKMIHTEIFSPPGSLPPHTDNGGSTYMIALTDGKLVLNGHLFLLKSWNLYSFDDGLPHTTSGTMLMVKEVK